MPEAPAMIVAGRYRLVHRIAAGGMGEIFLAVQDGPQGFQKLVALKRILPGVATDRNTVQHFLDEAQLTSRLSHRNIAQVFDFGQDREGYFAAMEYVQGPTMASLLDRLAERHQRLAPALALDIAAQVADALAYAWEVRGPDGAPSRVVHRDISPQNIMVSVSGDVKLIDFGVAKSAQQLHATIGSSIKGKLAYMSPEQGSGDPIDTRSDLFCLGVVLCEMLTGVHPFARNDLLQIMQAARSEPPKLPSAIDPSLAFIDSALLKMLAKDPRERFQDGHEAHEALQALRPKAPASPLRLGALVSECFGQELDALVSKDRLKTPPTTTPGAEAPPSAPWSPSRPVDPRSELSLPAGALLGASSGPRALLRWTLGASRSSHVLMLAGVAALVGVTAALIALRMTEPASDAATALAMLREGVGPSPAGELELNVAPPLPEPKTELALPPKVDSPEPAQPTPKALTELYRVKAEEVRGTSPARPGPPSAARAQATPRPKPATEATGPLASRKTTSPQPPGFRAVVTLPSGVVSVALDPDSGSVKLTEAWGMSVFLDYAATSQGLRSSLRCDPWAIVAINGESVGKTPVQLPSLHGKPLDLELRRPGQPPLQLLLSARR